MEATQKGVSRRDEVMEEIIRKRNEEVKTDKNFKPVGGETPLEEISEEPLGTSEEETPEETPEETQEGEETQEETPEVEMITVLDDEGNEYQVPKTGKVKLKIDGEEKEATLDQVTRNYQKGAAGDKRLQEASAILRQIEEKTRALTEKEQAFQMQMQAAQEQRAKGNLSQDDYQEAVRELVTAFVDADEERALELLQNIIPPPSTGALDPQAVEQVVERRMRAIEQERALKEAQERFTKEYKDLASDPKLFDLVDMETIRVQKEKPYASPWEVISEAAENVKKWRDGVVKPKKTKPKVPTPARGRASIGGDEPKPQTIQDVFREIKESRGQPITL